MPNPVTATTQACATYAATDAGFRIWARAHHDALVAAGLAVAYQGINFDTVTMPTVGQTVAGSVVYELNDELSGERPIYVKIGFGRGSTSSAQAGYRIDVQIGTTHNGSGTVGGVAVATYLTCNQASTQDGQILVYRQAGGFALMSNFQFPAYQVCWFLFVERLCFNGEPTTDGAVMGLAGQAANTTGTSAGQLYTAHINCLSGNPSGPYDLGSGLPWGLMPYNGGTGYNNYAPLARVTTYGKYDPLCTWFAASRATLGVSNAAYTGLLDGEPASFRTPYGLNVNNVSYCLPAVRTA